MNVSLLNLRITFQKNTVTIDLIGNHKNEWTDCYSCYATINSESGAESEKAGTTNVSSNAAFTVRYCKEVAVVTPDQYRILYGDEICNIISIDHQNNKRKSMKFWVQRARR